MNIEEGNKLIAEFMGLEHENGHYRRIDNNVQGYDEGALLWYEPKNMYYHNCWDWLIPVLEKIESFGFLVEIKLNKEVIIMTNDEMDRVHNYLDHKPSIQGVWSAVCLFIEYYNEFKKQYLSEDDSSEDQQFMPPDIDVI